MPKLGERFNIIDHRGNQIAAEWRGEFQLRNGTWFWILQDCYGEATYVKPKNNFAAYLNGGKAVKLAEPEGKQTP